MKRLYKSDGKYVKTWIEKGSRSIHVFDIENMDDLNSMVGLAKYYNSDEGTVLYRGQCELFDNIIPKIEREEKKYPIDLTILQDTLDRMYDNKSVNDFFKWNKAVVGWKLYIETALEAALQHYGAKTGSLDLVDNHWTALWFALNEYNSATSSYTNRYNKQENSNMNADDPSNSGQSTSEKDYGYLFLYLADTNAPSIGGLYFGKDSYTVDLRKALPPAFLRPMSQHGWVVKEKKSETSPIGKDNPFFVNNVVGVLRIKISLIDEMLGNGILLSQRNFFPDPAADKGYKKLLSLQGSVLPQKMLEEYKT